MRRKGHAQITVRAQPGDALFAADLGHLAHAGYEKTVTAGSWRNHEHARLEIHYFVRGIVRCWVGRELCEVSGGDVLIVPAGTPHGGWLGVRPPAELYWMGILPWHPAKAEQPFGLSAAESRALHDALNQPASPCLRLGDRLLRPFESLVASFRSTDGRSLLVLRSALLDILCAIVQKAHEPEVAASSEVVRAANDVIQKHLTDPVPVAELARKSGYSTAYFVREFHRKMGVSPKDYYVRCRVLEACRRLGERTTDITRIGHDLGFASSQYFATAFKRVTGMSPSAYQAACVTAATPPRAEHWPD